MSAAVFRRGLVAAAWFMAMMTASAWCATLSERTYRQLMEVQKLMEAGKLEQAQARLQPLLARVKDNPYAHAVALQTQGYLQAARERYPQAIASFEQALALGALPEDVSLELRYNIAQLQAALEHWRQAAESYEAWLAKAKHPSAESYAFGATLHAQLERYRQAVASIRKAIALSKRPREEWYRMLAALHYRRNDLKAMAQVLEKMVTLWPQRARYWKQLASVHHLLGHRRRALAVLALAYRQGFLEQESELLSLVNLYLQQKIPYRAARILEREMAAGRIRRSGRNLQWLGEIWMQAREDEAAIEKLAAAARIRKSGALHLRLARLYYDREQWSKVVDQARRARRLGGLSNPGDAWLLEGMALEALKRWDEALAAFARAEKYPATASQARQWRAYVEGEAL